MRRVLTNDLYTAINSADVHPETQGMRIEYDTKDFNISAEYNEMADSFVYTSYDVSDKKVTLTADQETIVKEFVQALHDTEKDKQKSQEAQF